MRPLLVKWVLENDESTTITGSAASILGDRLAQKDALDNPFIGVFSKVAEVEKDIGVFLLQKGDDTQALSILKSLHCTAEFTMDQISDSSSSKDIDIWIRKQYVAEYASYMLQLGEAGIKKGEPHYVYRVMETLCYLGCNAAKMRSDRTVVACMEAIVQLARHSRKEKIGCFWSRCIIPLHKHAQEFLSDIITWLTADYSANGDFFLKREAEIALSRIIGYQNRTNPGLLTNLYG